MYNETNKVLDDETETVSDNTNKQNTSNNSNTSIEASGTIDDVPDINDVLPSSSVFGYPLLDEFLGNNETRPSILNEVEFISGQFGESVGLRLKDTWYRSSSKSILEETKKLFETKNLPVKVVVAKRRSKTGRIYHTLRGGQKEE